MSRSSYSGFQKSVMKSRFSQSPSSFARSKELSTCVYGSQRIRVLPPPTLPLAPMARPFAASQLHCYAPRPECLPQTRPDADSRWRAFRCFPSSTDARSKRGSELSSMELTACLHLLFRLATDSVSTRLAWACRAFFSSSTFHSRSRPFGAPQSRPNI